MDEDHKERLLDQFRCYLDSIDTVPVEPDAACNADAMADLFTGFVELAALRNEVRGESRLVKDALDQFRAVFTTLQSSQAALEQELRRNQTEARERAVLVELLELRDRLVAGLQRPMPPVRWIDRFRRRRSDEAESWREGMNIMLRRLDRIVDDRRVVPIKVVGRPFYPRQSRVVGTARDVRDVGAGSGIVVEEIRAGFLWDEDLLRIAEVIVNAADSNRGEYL